MTTLPLHEGSPDAGHAGEAYLITLTPGQPVPDVDAARAAGVLLLPLIEGNLSTGDPVGDAAAAVALADQLDPARTPTPALALRLDPGSTREQLTTASRYAPLWADAVAARGWRPVIASSPDVIFQLARAQARFEGAIAEAFEHDTNDPAQLPEDPRTVAGLPDDIYPGLRGLRFAPGAAITDDALPFRIAPAPPAAPAGDPEGFAPPRFSGFSDAEGTDLADRLAKLEKTVGAIRDTLAVTAEVANADTVAVAQLRDVVDQLKAGLAKPETAETAEPAEPAEAAAGS